MRHAAAVLMAGLAVAASSAAAPAADSAADAKHIREIADRYARCVIGESARKARRYLVELGQPPIAGSCLVRATSGSGGQMRFPGQNYRYALAGALLVHDYPSGVPAELSTAPKLVHDEPGQIDEATPPADGKKAEAMRAAASRRRSIWLMGVLGDCVARANPDAAFALARSDVGSAAERDAFATLKPALAGCLPVQATIGFDPATLRGTIALNLYRLAYSVKVPADA